MTDEQRLRHLEQDWKVVVWKRRNVNNGRRHFHATKSELVQCHCSHAIMYAARSGEDQRCRAERSPLADDTRFPSATRHLSAAVARVAASRLLSMAAAGRYGTENVAGRASAAVPGFGSKLDCSRGRRLDPFLGNDTELLQWNHFRNHRKRDGGVAGSCFVAIQPSRSRHQRVRTGASDIIGRLVSGQLSDRKFLQKRQVMAMGFLLMASSLISLIYANTMALLVLTTVLYGLAGGSLLILFAVIAVEYLGLKNLPLALSFQSLACALVAFPRPLLIGYYRDRRESYAGLYALLAATCLAAGLVWTAECFRQRRASERRRL
ncbi:uncharacterized protein LOC144144460 isoform X3 [Haemaphysalis longicornis]